MLSGFYLALDNDGGSSELWEHCVCYCGSGSLGSTTKQTNGFGTSRPLNLTDLTGPSTVTHHVRFSWREYRTLELRSRGERTDLHKSSVKG